MKLIIGYKGADLLPSGSLQFPKHLTAADREKIKIAVIDDEKFEPRSNLKRLGYDIQELDDIKSLDEVKGFDAVLVDLMGVGMKFDTRNQGAILIKEIKRNHPSIFVGVYSGAESGNPLVLYAKQNADLFIKKDEDIDTISGKLDEVALKASSPSLIWGRLRQSLVKQGVSTRDLLEIEHEYVTQFLSKNPSGDSILKTAMGLEIPGTAKDVLKSLAASYIFRALTGA